MASWIFACTGNKYLKRIEFICSIRYIRFLIIEFPEKHCEMVLIADLGLLALPATNQEVEIEEYMKQ